MYHLACQTPLLYIYKVHRFRPFRAEKREAHVLVIERLICVGVFC